MARSAHILVTRPLGQHGDFIAGLQAEGLTVAHLPCIDIVPVRDHWPTDDPLSHADHVLFTSVNAVAQADRLRPLPWDGVAVLAIGSATADALSRHGQPLAFLPQSPFDSEAMLQQLDTVRPGRLCLIKGVGGRNLLSTALAERGWQVQVLDIYRRVLPAPSEQERVRLLSAPTPDLISVTSNEILQNLVQLAGEQLAVLQRLPLIVNSERAIELARDLGFQQRPLVARPPGDAGQLACVRLWLKQRSPNAHR